MYDLICGICGLDPKTAPGASISKVRKSLLKVGWTSKGLTTYRDWRVANKKGSLESIWWLATELAKMDWRGAKALAKERKPDQKSVEFLKSKKESTK